MFLTSNCKLNLATSEMDNMTEAMAHGWFRENILSLKAFMPKLMSCEIEITSKKKNEVRDKFHTEPTLLVQQQQTTTRSSTTKLNYLKQGSDKVLYIESTFLYSETNCLWNQMLVTLLWIFYIIYTEYLHCRRSHN